MSENFSSSMGQGPNSIQANSLAPIYNDNFYYYLITLKNNKAPNTPAGWTQPTEYTYIMAEILAVTKSEELKCALELDTNSQLHLHSLIYTKKKLNPIWLNKYIKNYYKNTESWMINTQIIATSQHYNHAWLYLDSNLNVMPQYNSIIPNEFCDFLD